MITLFENLKSGFEKLSKKTISLDKAKKFLDDLKLILLQNDVAIEVAEKICKLVAEELEGEKIGRFDSTKKLIKYVLKKAITDLLNIENINLLEEIKEINNAGKPYIICFLGVNGTGKTTTIAKIGNYLKKNNLKCVVAASDTYRAGAIEQLSTHMKNVGIKMISHKYKSDPSSVAYDAVEHAIAKKLNVVLIDTSGMQVNDKNLMEERKKIVRVVEPNLIVFIGDSLAGNDALRQAQKFDDEVGIHASILTKLDADSKGGAALSIIYATRKPILAVGVGQGYDDIELFDPEVFIEKILSLEDD